MGSIPIVSQLFDAFLGRQEGIHSVLLPDVFSSGGSKNLYMDKFARAKKINGYTEQNATAVTTNTGGSATFVRAINPYRDVSGGSVTRQLIGAFDDGSDEFELWYSTDSGATWTFIADLGAGSVGSIPDFSQFGDTLYITNGVVAPRKWDGTTLSTVGRTQSPTPTAVAGAAGQLRGHYKYKLVSMKGGDRQAGSDASTSVNLSDTKATVTWTADSDVDVTGYELYRTTGTGEVYYFVDFINLRTTVTYTDNKSDLDILENRVMAEHGDPPPTGTYHLVSHKQRMWWGRTYTNPTRVYWSDPGLPEDVSDQNFLDFSDGETIGDRVTGMIGNVEGKLVIGTERAIWTVSGTGQVIGNIVDWTRIKTNAQIGMVHGRTAVKIPAGAKYTDQEGKTLITDVVTLAYITPYKDIRLFDGDNDVVISDPIKTTLDGLNYAHRQKCFAITDSDLGEVAWLFPDGSEGEPNTAVVWNYRWGVWYTREWPFSCGKEIETANDSSILLGGSRSTTTGGHVYLLNNGNSFDGSAIEAVWMTKDLYGVNEQGQPAISNTKRYRWIDFLWETEQTASITVEWLEGNSPDNGASVGSVTVSPAASNILTDDGDRLVSNDGDPIIVALGSTGLRVILKDSSGNYLHDEGIRIRLKDNATNGSWSIEALNLFYQILPGLQRRMQG